MKRAIFRLFLIILPLIPLMLMLSMGKKKSETRPPYTSQSIPSVLEKNCPFFLAISPQFFKQSKKNSGVFLTFLIKEQDFLNQIKMVSKKLQTRPYLSLPIYQTKDGHWLVSQKSFVMSKDFERIEISHLNYKKLQNKFIKKHGSKALSLTKILQYFPHHNLFLKIKSKNEDKILKHLSFLKKHKPKTYVFSPNQTLLQKIKQTYPSAILIHSFKKMIRSHFFLALSLQSFVDVEGDGILIPNHLPIAKNMLVYMKDHKKLLIIEKNKPSQNVSKYLSSNISGLIVSNLSHAKDFISHNKNCF